MEVSTVLEGAMKLLMETIVGPIDEVDTFPNDRMKTASRSRRLQLIVSLDEVHRDEQQTRQDQLQQHSTLADTRSLYGGTSSWA